MGLPYNNAPMRTLYLLAFVPFGVFAACGGDKKPPMEPTPSVDVPEGGTDMPKTDLGGGGGEGGSSSPTTTSTASATATTTATAEPTASATADAPKGKDAGAATKPAGGGTKPAGGGTKPKPKK